MELKDLRSLPHLSSSAVSDYIDCGLLYKLGRIDKVPRGHISADLLLGTAIHLALAEYYQDRMIGEIKPLKEIIDSFERHWEKTTDREDVKFGEGANSDSYCLLGKELLGIWHEKLPSDSYQILAIEEPFSFMIPGIDIPLIGAIDLIEEDSAGTIIITDWKTSGRSYSSDEVNKSMQLTLYQMAMRANGYKDREILLRFDCLIKTKTPKFEQYWTVRSDADEIRVKKKIYQVWDGITKGVFIPNDGHWKCGGCAYRAACDAWFSETQEE